MEYWEETVKEALSELGISATEKQTSDLIEWIDGAHDNYGMAHGVASANWESDESKELKRLKAEEEKRRMWELETEPCSHCTTKGVVKDGWGRDVTCPSCNGKGRV